MPAIARRPWSARCAAPLARSSQERGLVGQNVVRSLRAGRRRGKETRTNRRLKGRRRYSLPGRNPRADRCARPLLLTAIFTGLRASELRGLRWEDVDLKVGELHVRQRANSFNAIGRPKSEAGERTVPLPPMLVNVLRELRLAGPKGDAAHSNDFSVFFATSMKARSLGANEARRG